MSKSLNLRLWSIPVAIYFVVACSDTSFSGSSGKKSEASSQDSKKNTGSKVSHEDNNGKKKPSNTDSESDSSQGLGGDAQNESDTGAGGPSTEILENGQVRQLFKGESSKITRSVDIVFSMDTSGSMGDEQASLQTNMTQFISRFETEAKSVDYRIYMIGQNFNFPGTGDKIIKINQSIGSSNSLEVLQNFFSGVIPNPTPLRQDSLKQIVVVTDDEAAGGTGAAFKSFLASHAAFQGKTKFNGFVGLPTSVENAACSLAGIGQQYITLGSDPQFAGLIQDICSPDWSKLLKDLASSIITDVTRGSFKLDFPVDVSTTIEVLVNGSVVEAGIVIYEAASQSITFQKGKEPPPGAEVVVIYTRT